MTDIERIEQRLAAVERTVTGDDFDLEELRQLSEFVDELEAVRDRLDDLAERVADVEGDVEALGGYASEVESVNTDVERQAYAAYATVDRLEDRIDEVETRLGTIEATDDSGSPTDGRSGTATGDAAASPTSGPADDGPSRSRHEASDPRDGDAQGEFGPFVPATADGGPNATDGSQGASTSVAEAVAKEEKEEKEAGPEPGAGRASNEATGNRTPGAGGETADRESVDQLFDATTADDADASTPDDGDDDGILASLRAKLS